MLSSSFKNLEGKQKVLELKILLFINDIIDLSRRDNRK